MTHIIITTHNIEEWNGIRNAVASLQLPNIRHIREYEPHSDTIRLTFSNNLLVEVYWAKEEWYRDEYPNARFTKASDIDIKKLLKVKPFKEQLKAVKFWD